MLRAIETFKTSIELIGGFPQSTSLAKINRWMLEVAVFRRSNWLQEGLQEAQKNAALGPKSASLTKMVQQLRHSHILACVVCQPPPNISQGLAAPERKAASAGEDVKVAVPWAGKTQAKMLVVYCIVLRAFLVSQIK
ncbi:hypothetical protein QUB63_11105 [Microcoleus sp. ARI1-B5]|uniref:hypothetical protein n=1 Tax=unclassified Microcoleus TaxID=2642155 RepID=UPI002FD69468